MKQPFKVGDRVAVYDVDMFIDGARPLPKPMGSNGTITGILKSGLIAVDVDRWDPPGINTFHPKQCRRLVPKKRREIWIYEGLLGKASEIHTQKPEFLDGMVNFIEVKK